MNCKNCGKIILDFMNFCPYCGHLEGKPVIVNEIAKDKEKIELLYRDHCHDEILEYAIKENNIAKCYYIRYVMLMANQSQLTDDKDFINNLRQKMDSGSAFAASALGIYLFLHGKKGFLGSTDDEAIKKGHTLILRSADNEEPAAMTFLAERQLKGDGIDKDEFSAYRTMKAAAEKGYPQAIYKLGLWHYQGIGGISKNEEQGFFLIEKAAFLGDVSARQKISEEYSGWFETELKPFISDENLMKINKLISHQQHDKIDSCKSKLKVEYDKCTCVNDYLELHKKLRKNQFDDENAGALSSWIETLIAISLELPLNETSIENALQIKADVEKALQLAKQYECPQHFLHFKDDIKQLGLQLDDSIMNWLLSQLSSLLRPSFMAKYSSYSSYIRAREKANEATKSKTSIIFYIFILIISGIVSMFFLPGGFILFGLIVFADFLTRKDVSAFKKIPDSVRNDYLLLNSLIGYGYTPYDSHIADSIKYYEDDIYHNPIPSILKKTNSQKIYSSTSTDRSKKIQTFDSIESKIPLTAQPFAVHDMLDTSQSIVCPSCKKENKNKSKFCSYCGVSFVDKKCPKCNAPIKEGQKFCSFCGEEIVTI